VHAIQFPFLDSLTPARASMPVEPPLPDVGIDPSSFQSVVIAHPESRIYYPIF